MSEPTMTPGGSPATPSPASPPSRANPMPTLALWAAGLALLLGLWNAAGVLSLRDRLHGAGDSGVAAAALARQALDTQRDLAARLAVLEARQQDLGAQRQSLDQLNQLLAKSRDQALLRAIETDLRTAQQQAALSASPAPLLDALAAAAQRLKSQPGVHAAQLARAIQADQQQLRSLHTPDLATTAARLDQVDALLGQLQDLASASRPAASPHHHAAAAATGWRDTLAGWTDAVWQQFSQLIRVTRVDQPDALLLSPQQADLARQNLRLRLLAARLDLLAHNAAAYRADLGAVDAGLRRLYNPAQGALQQALQRVGEAGQIDLTTVPGARLQSLQLLSNLDAGAP